MEFKNDPTAFLTTQYNELEAKYKETLEGSNLVKPLKSKIIEVRSQIGFNSQRDNKIKDLIDKNSVLANYVTKIKNYRIDPDTVKDLKKSFDAVKIATSKIVSNPATFSHFKKTQNNLVDVYRELLT